MLHSMLISKGDTVCVSVIKSLVYSPPHYNRKADWKYCSCYSFVYLVFFTSSQRLFFFFLSLWPSPNSLSLSFLRVFSFSLSSSIHLWLKTSVSQTPRGTHVSPPPLFSLSLFLILRFILSFPSPLVLASKDIIRQHIQTDTFMSPQ